MSAMLGVAMPPVENPIECSSDESEADYDSDEHGSDTESECERGLAGADADTKKSTKDGATTRSVMSTLSKLGASVKNEPEAKDEEEENPRGQCNLDDEENLEVWEEPRILECKLSEQQKATYKKQLERIFSKETVMGKRIMFEPDEVLDVMFDVEPYLNSEPMLIEDVPFDVIVVGDLHGQLYDLNRIFKQFAKDGKPGWECRKFVFLGDYVDRGRQSLEIVMALFIIKMLHPDRIWLLRGNHEFMTVNVDDGFQMEIYRRYNFEYPCKHIYLTINMAFCYLSVGAIIGDTWLCAHAGVSGANFTRRSLRGIYKPYIRMGQDTIINDMVWSDPAKGLMGSSFNATRGTSTYFGLPVLVAALSSMRCKGMIRGHTIVKEGHETLWNVLHSVFSATDASFKGNKGAVAIVDAKGGITFAVMDVKPLRSAWERAHRETDVPLPEEKKGAVPAADDDEEPEAK